MQQQQNNIKGSRTSFESAVVVPRRGGGGYSPLGLSAPLVLADPRRAGHDGNPFPHHPEQPENAH
ncbi:hypothetical protein E2C01_072674 [Portunus trituberculatus]|uniref:Uncharacterized protein n=1 Tax=Portunus trituberculatus TaxID=210409 RepID=A0A5B7I364_PORTR|nr:hypothetical protein [Portunus trituberculatus]